MLLPNRKYPGNRTPPHRARAISAALLAGLASCAAPPSDGRSYSGVSFTLENDTFVGSDNNFTNGFALSVVSREISELEPDSFARKWRDVWAFLPGYGDEGHRDYMSWTFGQEMFTPDDIDDPDPPLDDQPYAGVLYLENALHSRGERSGQVLTVRVGVVGPSSLAEQVQTEVHALTDASMPQGWDTQLPDEPILNIDYTAGYVLGYGDLPLGATWRFAPLGSASLGTYSTGLGATAYAEVGWNLAPTIASSVLRTGLDGTVLIGAEPDNRWSFSAYLGAGGYYIAHFLPLDGTVFQNSRSVSTEPFVGAVSFGITLRRGMFVLGLGQTYFSEAFETQRARDEYGAVTLGFYL